MQGDIFSGKWHQFKGKVKEKWGKLTDNDLTQINGNRERLLGILQERYGWEQKRAQDELKKFEQMYTESRENERKEGFEGREDREGKQWRNERDEEPADREGKQWRNERDEDQEGGEGKSKKRKIG